MPLSLLLPTDPPPAETVNPGGSSALLLIGDHAGRAIPAALGSLGLAPADLGRHIAHDIGTDALGRALARRLGAVFIHQRYSRLVIDCNRDPSSPEAVPADSDGTAIPGNIGLDADNRRRRVAEIHAPYHAAIAAAMATRPADDILVSLHSFTPGLISRPAPRPWHIGVLHDGHNDGFARRLLAWLEANSGMINGDNEPYRMDSTDHSVPRHAFAAHRPYVELEVRQDLLGDDAGIEAIAVLLAAGLVAAQAEPR